MITQGSIIEALVCDPQGNNPKPRPLVVVSTLKSIIETDYVFAVSITSIRSCTKVDDEVEMPYHSSGRCGSGLKKSCVAKCTWINKIKKTSVMRVFGSIHGPILKDVVNRIPKS